MSVEMQAAIVGSAIAVIPLIVSTLWKTWGRLVVNLSAVETYFNQGHRTLVEREHTSDGDSITSMEIKCIISVDFRVDVDFYNSSARTKVKRDFEIYFFNNKAFLIRTNAELSESIGLIVFPPNTAKRVPMKVTILLKDFEELIRANTLSISFHNLRGKRSKKYSQLIDNELLKELKKRI